jgi:hypothetical protein
MVCQTQSRRKKEKRTKKGKKERIKIKGVENRLDKKEC